MKFALVTTYSFDDDMPVWLFDTFEQAQAEMERQIKEEIRIATEENEKILDVDVVFEINDGNGYVKYFLSHDPYEDVMKWHIGNVRN